MLPTVFEPISFSGSLKSTIGRRGGARETNPEMDIPIPGQMRPPRKEPSSSHDVKVDRRAEVHNNATGRHISRIPLQH